MVYYNLKGGFIYMRFHNTRFSLASNNTHITKPEYLVFSGGGIKGIAYSGSIEFLEEKKLLANIKGYAGASAGAITAALLAIGMTSKEIQTEMNTVDFSTFLQKSNINIEKLVDDPKALLDPIIGAKFIFDEIEHKGLCDASVFTSWLTQMFVKKGFSQDTTFEQLFNSTNKCLKVMLCNVNYGKTLIADYENTPDMPVVKAVRGSMSIPFVFEPLEWNGDLYVDGGTMYNYPIEVFDNEDVKANTLGFILSTKESVLNPKRKSDNNIIEHIECIISSVLNVSYEYCFRTGNQYRTVFVNPADIKTLDFNLTNEQKQMLYKNGYDATQSYIG